MASPVTQPSPWVPVSERLPPEHQQVLVLIAAPNVAIYAHPTAARLQYEYRGTDRERVDWWAGVPGNWMAIRPGDGWTVTHWARLPEFEDCAGEPGEFHRSLRAAAWDGHHHG